MKRPQPTGARDAPEEFSDSVDLRTYGVDPAHQADRRMHHAFPEPELVIRAGRLGPLRQALGIIAQRIELASRDVEWRQTRQVGEHRDRERTLPIGLLRQVIVQELDHLGRAQE